MKEPVAEVGLGQAGVVLALGGLAPGAVVGRLAPVAEPVRTDPDADRRQRWAYSPQDFNDRLLLGVKGAMREVELHLIRSRPNGGLRNKARRAASWS